MNNLPLRIGHSVSSNSTKIESFFDILPRGWDIAGSIRKCKEINDYQKRSTHIQKVESFEQKDIHFQSSLIV